MATISDIEGIGEKQATILKGAGIKTVDVEYYYNSRVLSQVHLQIYFPLLEYIILSS